MLFIATILLAVGIVSSSSLDDKTVRLDAKVERDGSVSVFESTGIPVWAEGTDFVAHGSYKDMNDTNNGWGMLEIHTNPSACDHHQAYSAGFLEGRLTGIRIYHTYLNNNPRSGLSKKVYDFFHANNAFLASQIQENPNDPYWHQVDLVLSQLRGLVHGYQSTCSSFGGCGLDETDFLLLNAGGDLEDLLPALGIQSAQVSTLAGSGKCSALIKLLPDLSDLFISQVTWSGFGTMIRIWKLYDFAFRAGKDSDDLAPGNRVVFSGYPGSLLSGDDYYLTGNQLVILETTIGNANQTLFDLYVKPNTVLDWVRNIVANRLASSGKEWTDTFSRYNSGTYNNEWIVVDLKLFTPGEALSDNLVWLLDQIPGYIVAEDVTPLLRSQHYIPSYNVPYFPSKFDLSNSTINVDLYGDWFTYDKCPRANIFRRDQSKVVDLESMQRIMRYNDFQHDPLSDCACSPIAASGENAISARSDLNPINGVYAFSALGHRAHGGIDAKITSASVVAKAPQSLPTWAVAGPTYDQQPVFSWESAVFIPNVTHIGHPTTFDFDWQFFSFSS